MGRLAGHGRVGPDSRGEVLRRLLLALVTCVLALLFGVLTAQADSMLGPHRATFTVDLSRAVVIDLGPLGAIHIDSPASPLGVTVTVHEIPASGSADPLDGLGSDVAAYAQLASHPRAALTAALDALLFDALGRAAIVAGLGLLGLSLLPDGLDAFAVTRRNAVAIGMVALALASLVVVPALTRPGARTVRAEVLDGTPFEGVRVSGRLADLVNAYGPQLVAAFEANEAFYDGLATRVGADFGPAVATAAPRSGWDLPAPVDGKVLTTAVFVTDLHCNVSMGRVVRALVEASGAEFVLNGGDTVVSGTAAEAFCVDAFAQEVRVPVVVADGNHDSPVTAQQEDAAGWQVLRGEVVEVAGLRILGDTDPTVTAVASGTLSERDETIPAMGRRLADAACRAADVDVLLVHNPRAASATADRGCAAITLSGHLHRRVGPELNEASTWRYISSSSGGGNEGGRTIGTLQSAADLTVIRFDADGAPVQLAVLTVGSGGAVTVDGWHELRKKTPTPSTSSTTS